MKFNHEEFYQSTRVFEKEFRNRIYEEKKDYLALNGSKQQLSDLKVLILDDNVFKAMDIKRALDFCGIKDMYMVTDQSSGMEYIYKCSKEESKVDLIITDMHYPLKKGIEADIEAGLKLIKRVNEEGLDIPVIVCSSLNYRLPNILGTVWYNRLRDLKMDFREILERLK